MRIVAMFFTVLLGSCLQACIVSPMRGNDLFGDQVAKEKAIYFEGAGVKAGASTEMKWKFDAEKDPVTGRITVHSDLDSNPTPVVAAGADLVTAMYPALLANFQSANTRQQLINEQIGLAYSLINNLGDKALEAFPILWPNGLGGGTTTPMARSPTLPLPLGPSMPLGLDDAWKMLSPEEKAAWLARMGIPIGAADAAVPTDTTVVTETTPTTTKETVTTTPTPPVTP